VFALWKEWETEQGKECDVPFWAVVWPGACVLARYVLNNTDLVAGKTILDFGCGSGVAGIAAAKAGASCVCANDIDPVALSIANLHAHLNNVGIVPVGENLLKNNSPGRHDVIFAADMFYNLTQSNQTLEFLKARRRDGARVFIADAERPFAPKSGVRIEHEETVTVSEDLEGVAQRKVRILALE
jgi:predicted nicotinamide N-methyase